MAFPSLETSWTPETLAARLHKTAEKDRVEAALETATALLEQKLAERWRDVPTSVYDVMVVRVVRAVIEGDGRQFTEAAPTQLGAGGGAGPRAPRDPLEAASGLIAAYVLGLA